MTTAHEERHRAIGELIRNARAVSNCEGKMGIVKKWPGLVVPKVDGKPVPLPGYVPYVGSEYFSPRTRRRRILAYALSQNLRPEDPHVLEWAKDWACSDGRIALDRQNESFARCGSAMMHPFDTGHIPVLCVLLRSCILQNAEPGAISSIYAEIAATNLSKFSFRAESGRTTTDYNESLSFCWEWFSVSELEMLSPDFILCAGATTYRVVAEGVAALNRKPGASPIVLHVAFPSVRVINRWYGKKQKPVGSGLENILPLVPKEDLDRTVEQNGRRCKLCQVVERDWYYFSSMLDSMTEQLKKHRATA